MRPRTLFTAAAFAAGLTAGGAGMLIATPVLSFAQEAGTTTTTPAADDVPAAPEGVEGCGEHGGGPRGHGHRLGGGGTAAAAEALGMTADELRDTLRDGRSMAEVAAEKGVDVQTVIDAVVAARTAAIDEAVAAGDLDGERAATMKEHLVERVTAMVNGERPERGPGGRGRGPGGRGGPGMEHEPGS